MKSKLILAGLYISAIALLIDFSAAAAPYGIGKYNASVPYGGTTYLSISAAPGVSLSLNPSVSGTLGSGSGTVTVYSTDVVGFKLYIRALTSTVMSQGSYQIPASVNSSAGPLAVNTWGYNNNGSTNFLGMTMSNVLLKDFSGPMSSGDITTITYGLNIDRSKPAGSYASKVIYTAVPKTP